MTITPIFGGARLSQILTNHTQKVLTSAAKLEAAAWRPLVAGGTPRDPATDLGATLPLFLPQVNWAAAVRSVEETRVTVRERDSSGAVPGMWAVVSVPYVGTSALLQARPTKHVIGGITDDVKVCPSQLRAGTISITLTGRHLDPGEVDTTVERTHRLVEVHLRWIAEEVKAWRVTLDGLIRHEVDTRAAFLQQLSETASRIAS